MFVNTFSEIENFIQSLGLPDWIARGTLRTIEDCHAFYIGFYGRNKHVIDDILDYREMKIAELNISLETFLDMCYNDNLHKAFETTFLQSFSLEDLEFICKAIDDGRITLEEIFLNFKKNPNRNILKNVL